MKHLFSIVAFLVLCFLSGTGNVPDSTIWKHLIAQPDLRSGDIIFQASLSQQSKAIQLATGSRYSHCGIIYKEGNALYVYEAIQPVTKTRFDKWVARGAEGHYIVKRVKDVDKVLTPEVLIKLKNEGAKLAGKNYDLYFGWSDERIYCSELVWKMYKRATGLEIGKLQELGEFNLSHPAVKQKLKERYGDNIPLKEKVISPGAMFDSNLLYTVFTKGK